MIATKNELDEETKLKWYKIIFQLKKQFGKKPDMNGLLYLIGLRELGTSRNMNKEEKMDLFHVATCKLLSYDGYYTYSHTDAEGWPHYTLTRKPEFTDLLGQEILLRKLIVRYFDENELYDDEE
ncbi:MAG: hypothetical protein H3C45_02790 [Bacteroidia bacterium]|nr:hypothetical protein [Bacteroidia bacterium]